MLSKKVQGALAAVVLVGAAAGVLGVTDLRFWAWANDLRQVAQDSYTAQLTQIAIWITIARQQLDQCRAAGADCRSVIERIAFLEAEQARLLEKKARLGG